MLHAARGSRKNLALCLSGQPRGRNSVADLQWVSWPKEERRAFLQENYQVRQDCHEILLIKYHYQGCKVYSSFFFLDFHFSSISQLPLGQALRELRHLRRGTFGGPVPRWPNTHSAIYVCAIHIYIYIGKKMEG